MLPSYNFTIIPTVAVNAYAYLAVSSEFVHGGAWNTSETAQIQLGRSTERNMTVLLQSWHGMDLQSTIHSMQVNANNSTLYTYSSTLDCLLMYNNLMGNHSDLIMVSSAPAQQNNTLLVYGMAASGTWDIGYFLCQWGKTFDCGRLVDLPVDEQVQAVKDWNIGGYRIDYCLSSQRSTENHCSVEYSFSILLSKPLPYSRPHVLRGIPGMFMSHLSCVRLQLSQMHWYLLHRAIPLQAQ